MVESEECNLILREVDMLLEHRPDDGFKEGRGRQGALVREECLVLWDMVGVNNRENKKQNKKYG